MRTELPTNEFEALYKSVCDIINDAIDNGSESEEIEEDISAFLQEGDTNIHVIEEESKNSLLHYAIIYAPEEGNTRVIDLLIKAGLDVNIQNRLNRTPLYCACIAEKENTVALLLDKQANTNLGNPGDTPFLAVIRDDSFEKDINANIAKMLIQKGADINQASGKDRLSPLQLAVIHRKELIIKEIINSHRANLQLTDIDGNTALHMVAKYRDKDTKSSNLQKEKAIAELLIRRIDAINLQNKHGDTPLHLAVTNGNNYVVELLLEKDYLFPQMELLKIKNNSGLTAIHTAVQEAGKGENRLESLKLLIRVATQEDLNSVNNVGDTAIEMLNKLIKDAELGHNLVILDNATEMLELTAERLSLTAKRLIDENNSEKVANTAVLSKNALALSNFAKYFSNGLEELADKVAIPSSNIRELSVHVKTLASNAEKLSHRAREALDSKNLSAAHITELSSDAEMLFNHAKGLSDRAKPLLSNEESRRRTLNYHASMSKKSSDRAKQLLDNQPLGKQTPDYIHALRKAKHVLEQSDYLSWKNEKSTLPTSFPDYHESDNSHLFMDHSDARYQAINKKYKEGVGDFNAGHFQQAINKLEESVRLFEQVFPGHNTLAYAHWYLSLAYSTTGRYLPAKENIEESIKIFYRLKTNDNLEAAYKSLAITYINAGKAFEHEHNNKALLINNLVSDKERLFAHLALASLYGELKKQTPLPTGVSFDDLSIHESYHYSEAYKLTQGPIDSTANVVLQREMGVSNGDNLGTYNVQQCVVAVAYDPITKKVVLSHFDRLSGPLTFIKQILAEFPSTTKIDIYLSGGRDRSTSYYDTQGKYVVADGKKISDSNIDQVLKQLYFYKERFHVKSFDLGDNPSPEGIVFDIASATLQHRTPNHPDTSLHSRTVKMSRQMIKADYLRPLDKVDFSKSEASRQISFSQEQKQEILGIYHYYTENFFGQTEMWHHNQLLYPFTEVSMEGRNNIFYQALLENFAGNSNAGLDQFQDSIDQFDLSHLPQQNQKTINSDLTVLREKIDLNSNHPMEIDIDSDEKMEIDDEPSIKRQCVRERKKRNIEAILCIDSRDEEDIVGEKQGIREAFDTVLLSNNVKNIEFYDQLLKVSEQVSRDEPVDINAEEALIAAVNDINLNSVDTEIKDLVEEIKTNSENKEEIKNILRRSGVAEKIGKVAEGAGSAYTLFLVGKHIANGNLEGLGYDALNLWVLPKLGEKLSGQVLKLSEKYSFKILKGFAPILGRSIGNFGAFLGLGEAIKAREKATDPIDIKIAALNIATNFIFIAVDIPALVTEITSTAGVLGEFAGPVGSLVSVAVIVISDFIQSEFELEKLEEQISLTAQEEHEFYWDFFLGKKLPAYIERDIKAKHIYESYIAKTVKDFEAYDVIVLTLPPILITKKTRISACLKRCTDLSQLVASCGNYKYEWSSQEEITKIDFDANIRTKITNLWLNCFDFIFKPNETILSAKRPSCLDNRIILQHLYSNDSIYEITCGPVANDISATTLNIRDYMGLPDEKQKCDHRRRDKVLLSQTKERWFFNRYVPDCDNTVIYKRDYFREPHQCIYYLTSSDTEITVPYSTDIIFQGKRILNIEIIKNDFTVNRYHFSNLLEDCTIIQGNTTNFFYIASNQFSCYLGGMSSEQKNVVAIQKNFTDSENIHSIIGNNETNDIKVSHATYVDGHGGNDVITARHANTTIKAYFGDFIDGNGLVLLPMNFTDIVKITYANNRTVIYNDKAELISLAQQTLIKTADDFFVTPTRTDNETVTNLQIIKNVGHIVLYEELISLYDDAYFLDHLLTDLRKINNPHFGVNKQLNGKNYHIIIGDTGHHIFYPDKESSSFYWEAPEDIKHLYIFDKNSGSISISQANGLLDFIQLNSASRLPTRMNAEGDIEINKGNLQVTLLKNYKNVTITFDGKKYYKLQNAELTRDYCSHDLKIDGKFSINATDILNHYNCFTFDSEKVLFLKSNENLLLLSNKRALFIVAYYSVVHAHWDLSIRLNNHVIKPKKFREKANRPSFFRHYLVSEKGLLIYHNQPMHNQKIGLVDLKGTSALDCSMEVIKDNLLVSYKNNTLVEVANWNTYSPAREMVFIFMDAVVNTQCIASTCTPRGIIRELQKEKIVIKNTFLEQKRKKRHQAIESPCYTQTLASNDELAPSRSPAAKPSSWVNQVFSMAKEMPINMGSLLSTSSSSDLPKQHKVQPDQLDHNPNVIIYIFKNILSFFGYSSAIDRMNRVDRLMAKTDTDNPLDFTMRQLKKGETRYRLHRQ